MRRGPLLATGIALALCAPASASVRIGLSDADIAAAPSDLSLSPAGTAFNDSLAGGRLAKAPTPGIITGFKVFFGGGPATTWRPRVVRANGANYDWPGPILAPLPLAVGIRSASPLRVPVSAGDSMAVEFNAGVKIRYIGMVETGGYTSPPPAFESTNVPPNLPLSFVNAGLAVGADLETDADGDGFGDESQDACPTDPKRQDACVPPVAIDQGAGPQDTAAPRLTSCTKTSQPLSTQRTVRACVNGSELAALTMTGRLTSKKKTFDLGSTKGAVAPGSPATLELKLSKSAVKAVKKSGGSALLSVTGADTAGNKSLFQATVTAKKSRSHGS